MMSKNSPKVAIVHDELVRRGGAEGVLEELIRMYPDADIYALYTGNIPKITVDGRTYDVHTSTLQNWPQWFRAHPGRMLPFLPQATEQFDLSGYDIVLSSSSGFAKGVVTRSNVPHLCYCHAPTRYLWDTSLSVLLSHKFTKPILRILFHYLRMIDYAAAQRPNAYIANSQYTRTRIKSYYRRESTVVYPPIDTTYFTPHFAPPSGEASRGRPQNYFLCVGRLTREKRFDHAIGVAEKLGLNLVIVGSGSDYKRLNDLSGKHTTFVGKVSREELREFYRSARAFIQPGVEDFGMAAVEALACGTPVIALGEGGVTEIVRDGVHGILAKDSRPEALAEAIRQFIRIEKAFYPANLQKRALRFASEEFRRGIKKQVEYMLNLRNTTHTPL